MKRKLIKNGRGVVLYIPPAFLETLKAKAGDYLNLSLNKRKNEIIFKKED